MDLQTRTWCTLSQRHFNPHTILPVTSNNPEASCLRKTTLFPWCLPASNISTVPGVILLRSFIGFCLLFLLRLGRGISSVGYHLCYHHEQKPPFTTQRPATHGTAARTNRFLDLNHSLASILSPSHFNNLKMRPLLPLHHLCTTLLLLVESSSSIHCRAAIPPYSSRQLVVARMMLLYLLLWCFVRASHFLAKRQALSL